MNTQDPFFSLSGKSSQWNACIGNQGNIENYVDGYMEAALELVNAVIEQEQYIKRDTLAMPILYNARHALELSLKYMHDALCDENIIINPQPQNHDIHSYWKLLSSTKIGDKELAQYIEDLENYVVSLSKIDDDGQELRYAENRDGQKSLKDKSLCNLEIIRDSLLKLQKILSNAKHRLATFQDERKTSTFTGDCSRKDLEKISKKLPAFDKWKDNIFDQIKDEIKKEYGIGSKKFSDAVNLIKNHRTFASSLGKEFNLIHLTDEKIKLVINEWQKLHAPKDHNDLGMDYNERDYEEMFEYLQKSKNVRETIAKFLSQDEAADLEALFYIGRENLFCEFYEGKLASIKKEHKANNNLAQEIGHLIEKTNLLDCIIVGLGILGKPSLADELSQKNA
ncbi:MAG: hypothetical protein ACRBB3_08400 [Alphaproteobacteria bacterium]